MHYEYDRDVQRLKAWTHARIGARVAHVAECEAISKAKAAAELVRLGLAEHAMRREKRQRAEWGESLHTLPPDDGDGVRLKIPLTKAKWRQSNSWPTGNLKQSR